MKRLLLVVIMALLACGLVVGCADTTQPVKETESSIVEEQVDYPAGIDDSAVLEKLNSMSLEEKVAQLFIVRPETIAPDDGYITMMDDIVREGLSTNTPAGLCYFADNIENPTQLRALLEETQAAATDAAGLPLFQCVDEEGGEVARVANNTAMGVQNVGDMGRIGARGDADEAYEAASYIASYLTDLGFNVNFAPVADIADGVGNTMGRRAFETSAQLVVPMVEKQVEAFNDAHLFSSAKHFPGIGGASGDSHDGVIETDDTLEEMEESEFLPFEAAIDEGVPMVMVGHIACPEITGDDTPATFSKDIVTGLLRGKLGFTGIIVTDSLEMGGAEGITAQDQGVKAIQAGCDLILLPADYEKATAGLLKAVKSGEITQQELDEHVARIISAKLKLADASATMAPAGTVDDAAVEYYEELAASLAPEFSESSEQ